MKQNSVQIPYTDDLLLSLKKNHGQFERDARFFFALKLYEMEKISSGKAARLAGMGRVAFLMKNGNYNVSPFQTCMDEILEDAGR